MKYLLCLFLFLPGCAVKQIESDLITRLTDNGCVLLTYKERGILKEAKCYIKK